MSRIERVPLRWVFDELPGFFRVEVGIAELGQLHQELERLYANGTFHNRSAAEFDEDFDLFEESLIFAECSSPEEGTLAQIVL